MNISRMDETESRLDTWARTRDFVETPDVDTELVARAVGRLLAWSVASAALAVTCLWIEL